MQLWWRHYQGTREGASGHNPPALQCPRVRAPPIDAGSEKGMDFALMTPEEVGHLGRHWPRLVITRTNAGLLSIGHVRTNEIASKIWNVTFKTIHFKNGICTMAAILFRRWCGSWHKMLITWSRAWFIDHARTIMRHFRFFFSTISIFYPLKYKGWHKNASKLGSLNRTAATQVYR